LSESRYPRLSSKSFCFPRPRNLILLMLIVENQIQTPLLIIPKLPIAAEYALHPFRLFSSRFFLLKQLLYFRLRHKLSALSIQTGLASASRVGFFLIFDLLWFFVPPWHMSKLLAPMHRIRWHCLFQNNRRHIV